jgi:hypothetical protein
MKGRLVFYIPIVLIAISLNIYYYWGEIWTVWAKHYVKDLDIVVSMTTTPHRINKMEQPLECLSRQQIQPKQIFVSIPHIFKRDNLTYEIPDWLDSFPNVTILRTEDYGPATKLLGALKNAPINDDTIIVTADDDTCYPENWLLRLAVRAKQYPAQAVGVSGVDLDSNNKTDGIARIKKDRAPASILEGYGGVAYRSKFFDDSVYDMTAIDNPCYNSDDLYLSYHLAKNNIARQTLTNRFITFRYMKQEIYAQESDALYRMAIAQNQRYQGCFAYLQQVYPDVSFVNGINSTHER